KIDATGQDHEGHAHREHDQEGVVHEQVGHDLWRGECLVAERTDPESQDEHHERGNHREETLGHTASCVPEVQDVHAVVTSLERAGAAEVFRRPRNILDVRGDWSKQTAMTTSALKTRATLGGTPMA